MIWHSPPTLGKSEARQQTISRQKIATVSPAPLVLAGSTSYTATDAASQSDSAAQDGIDNATKFTADPGNGAKDAAIGAAVGVVVAAGTVEDDVKGAVGVGEE